MFVHPHESKQPQFPAWGHEGVLFLPDGQLASAHPAAPSNFKGGVFITPHASGFELHNEIPVQSTVTLELLRYRRHNLAPERLAPLSDSQQAAHDRVLRYTDSRHLEIGGLAIVSNATGLLVPGWLPRRIGDELPDGHTLEAIPTVNAVIEHLLAAGLPRQVLKASFAATRVADREARQARQDKVDEMTAQSRRSQIRVVSPLLPVHRPPSQNSDAA